MLNASMFFAVITQEGTEFESSATASHPLAEALKTFSFLIKPILHKANISYHKESSYVYYITDFMMKLES